MPRGDDLALGYWRLSRRYARIPIDIAPMFDKQTGREREQRFDAISCLVGVTRQAACAINADF
jgi:hypothetical protein